EARKHSLAETIDRYRADVLPGKAKSLRRNQHQQLQFWRNELGDYVLADVTPARITECRDKLLAGMSARKERRSPATVNRYLAALSHVFSVAVKEWGWIDDSPMRKVTKAVEPRGRVRFLSDDERGRLLAACQESSNPYLHTVVVLALSTGMRQGEIMQLRWQDVDLEKSRITLHETKNGERRVVPLTGKARQLLKEHAKVRKIDTPLLFPSKVKPSVPMDLRTPWENALEAAEIEDFR